MYLKKALLLVAAVGCTVGTNSANAALVSYSFTSNDSLSAQTGAGVIGSAGDQWMTEFILIDATGTTVDDVVLTDVNGDPTGATLSHLGLRRHNSDGQVIEAGNPVPLQNSVYMRHLNDDPFYLIEGLLPGSTADVVLFSTYHRTFGGINRGSSFTIDGNTKGTTGTGDRTTFEEDRNYVFFDNVLVGPSGSIQIDISGNNTNFSDVNGFQIEFTPIPEPSTMLLCLGSLAVCWAIRQRK